MLCREGFRLDIRQNLYTKRDVKHWSRLTRAVPIPGNVQKACRCGTWGSSLAKKYRGGAGLLLGLDGVTGLFQP